MPTIEAIVLECPAVALRVSPVRFGGGVVLYGLRMAQMPWPATPSRPGQALTNHVEAPCSAPYSKQGRSRAVSDGGRVLLMAA